MYHNPLGTRRTGDTPIATSDTNDEVDTAGEFGELTCSDRGVTQCRLQIVVGLSIGILPTLCNACLGSEGGDLGGGERYARWRYSLKSGIECTQ